MVVMEVTNLEKKLIRTKMVVMEVTNLDQKEVFGIAVYKRIVINELFRVLKEFWAGQSREVSIDPRQDSEAPCDFFSASMNEIGHFFAGSRKIKTLEGSKLRLACIAGVERGGRKEFGCERKARSVPTRWPRSRSVLAPKLPSSIPFLPLPCKVVLIWSLPRLLSS